jgi:hypothetical protein
MIRQVPLRREELKEQLADQWVREELKAEYILRRAASELTVRGTEVQPGLWDNDDKDEREEQRENLERVYSRIARAIIEFLRMHNTPMHDTWHADDLRKHVVAKTGIAAPASADRVLRDLRQRGIINYRVINRSQSLYKTLYVPPEGAKV